MLLTPLTMASAYRLSLPPRCGGGVVPLWQNPEIPKLTKGVKVKNWRLYFCLDSLEGKCAKLKISKTYRTQFYCMLNNLTLNEYEFGWSYKWSQSICHVRDTLCMNFERDHGFPLLVIYSYLLWQLNVTYNPSSSKFTRSIDVWLLLLHLCSQ